MLPQHANATKVARIEDMSGRHDAGEGYRFGSLESEPPVPLIEFRNRSSVEECELMKFCERVRDIVIIAVNLANSIIRRICVRARYWHFGVSTSFAKRGLDTEPHGTDKPGYNFVSSPLRYPDRKGVRRGAGAADIDEGA